MAKKIICFGELLLRMSPEGEGKWISDARMTVYPGGSELNAATALAIWKQPVSYCTAVPDNYLAKDLLQYLEEKNIGTETILISGERIGIYFLQQGRDLQHHAVIYDRAYSSFYELQPGSIDWDQVLEGVGWFHFSAISPALNQNIAIICGEALTAAKKKGIVVSVDLNYRSRLWQYGRLPSAVMPELVANCDLVMGNIWAAHQFLQTPLNEDLVQRNNTGAFQEHARITDKDMREKFPNIKWIANTFRLDHPGGGIHYYACLSDEAGQQYTSAEYDCDSVVDRIGSGDCFMAGLIYGLSQNHSPQNTIDFATAAAFGKMQVQGDATIQTVEQIKLLTR